MFRIQKTLGLLGLIAALGVPFARATTGLSPAKDVSVEQLKAQLPTANVGDRPRICIQIAEKQLDSADKLYAATESEKAQVALSDVAAFSEMARDYAIQSRKHQKQTEISVRRMAHKLGDIKHA